MPKAAMVGAGLIGRSWSIVFARAGWDVALYDSVTAVTDQAYAKVTEGNTRAWTYERALEVDREEADEPEEAPEKLPPAPRPPGARSADFHKKAAPKKRAKQD